MYEELGRLGVTALKQTLLHGSPKKDLNKILAKIQAEKRTGRRQLPSLTLVSIGHRPRQKERDFLVDTCARLVDQNWAGRHEMCFYFAVLIRHGLGLLGYRAAVEVGKVRYLMGGESFELSHAWVKTEFGDVVDGNADSLTENPFVPEGIEPKPYWGPPDVQDRKFHKLWDLPPERDEIELDSRVIRQWKVDLQREIRKNKRSIQTG